MYNLEVQGEHVYEVGQSGTLVHNHCAWLTILRNGKVWKRIENVLYTSGGVGGKLNWAQRRATDTEAKIVREFQGLVKEGDHLIIRGQLDPCNHCQRRMKEFVAATGAKVSYLWKVGRKPMSWVAERLADGRVKVVRSQGSKVIHERIWRILIP